MLWIDPQYLNALETASATDYDAVAALRPTDQFVEKQGRSTGRYIIAAAPEPISFFLKKYFRISWWRRWLAPLDSFPGPRERANLARAAQLGIRVAEPLVSGADRRRDCASLLAVRELVGYQPLHEFIPDRFAQPAAPGRARLRRAIAERLADVARRLHHARLYHCDFYLCHFFIRESAGSFDLVLIDLMRLKHSILPRWRVKDLAQLLYSSDLPGITRSDRLRFFKRYLGIARLDETARRLLRRVHAKAARYHRHNASSDRQYAA